MIYIHPENYICVQIDYSAENKADIVFHNVEAKDTYNKNFVVGAKLHTVLTDIPEMHINPGKNRELAVSFIVDSNGKTKEEVFNTITNGRIYVNGSLFIFKSSWKLDLSHLQTYNSIQQIK